MSNNKQSMKLYTEEQVREAFAISDFYGLTNGILEKCTPIELPSDEEKWNEADKEESNSKHYAFTRGAKWMRDKIHGGNNEQ